MKINIIVVASAIITTLIACNKPVYKCNKEFEGNWLTEVIYDSTLQINVQSQLKIEGEDGLYKGICQPCADGTFCSCIANHAGKAVMNSTKTEMKIGTGGNTYPLKIDEEPNIGSDGKWTMKIEGLRFYRQ